MINKRLVIPLCRDGIANAYNSSEPQSGLHHPFTSDSHHATQDCERTMAKKTSNQSRKRETMDVVDAKVAVDLATAQTYSENVFLFVPNLIGELFSTIVF